MTDSELRFRIELDRADTPDADAAAAQLSAELERHGFAPPSQESIEGFTGLGELLLTFGIPLMTATTPIIIEWIRQWKGRNNVGKIFVTFPNGTKLVIRDGSVEQFKQLLAATGHHGGPAVTGGEPQPRGPGAV